MEFLPTGAQLYNCLAESRFEAPEHLQEFMLQVFVRVKPTLNYTKLCKLLSRAPNTDNSCPVGPSQNIENVLGPLTVNQLFLGRTSSVGQSSFFAPKI